MAEEPPFRPIAEDFDDRDERKAREAEREAAREARADRQRDDGRRDERIHKHEFEEDLPAEIHELIVAQARERAAHENEKEKDREDF